MSLGGPFKPVHEQYARAIFHVCQVTPKVAHWLPTRMGDSILSLVHRGVTIPPNLSVMVSVQRGGSLEQSQLQAVRGILEAQPSANIGLSYFIDDNAVDRANLPGVQAAFGPGAVICPALTAKEPKDRVCAGCRRCWAATLDTPVIYPRT